MNFLYRAILFSFLNANILYAAESFSNDSDIQAVLKHSTEPNYFSMIIGLFCVIALIYITGYVYQKLIKVKIVKEEDIKNKAQIISTTPLGQNRALHVIKINGKYSLIGVGSNSITYLKDIDEIKEENKEN